MRQNSNKEKANYLDNTYWVYSLIQQLFVVEYQKIQNQLDFRGWKVIVSYTI